MKEKKPSYIFRLISILVICALIGDSCKVTKPYQEPARMTNDSLYRGISTKDTTNIATMSWRELFKDTLLQKLIDYGISQNTDLQIAMARMKTAAANFKQSKQVFYPSLSADAYASLQSVPPSQFGYPQTYQFTINASWMADIWGQLKSAKRAALASLLQSDAYRRAVLTQLISTIATDYYSLLALDAELDITQRTLELRKRDVDVLKVLKESDVVTGAAVVQAIANRYSVEITIPDLKQSVRETENALNVLMGKDPDTVYRSNLSVQDFSPGLNTGVPAQLLAFRPDVQEAEFQFRNAFELTNVARTYFYPSLNITASGGFGSIHPEQLFNPASFFSNIAGNLVQPIFSQGINKQRLTVAEAKNEEYLATFKQRVLNAGQEVSNALYSYQMAGDKEALRLEQINYLVKSVDYTKELLRYSSKANFLDVLTSEQSLLNAQLDAINDKLQKLNAIVSLYKSLGGGWQ
jgi:NodT family efflux transporter outer membrane factor (OMF) lipoprotein